MSEYYRVNIAGMERDLLRCPLNDKLDIAAFIIFGDVELTVHAAAELLKRLPEFDYIVTPEAKSIPLAYEMSRQSGKGEEHRQADNCERTGQKHSLRSFIFL